MANFFEVTGRININLLGLANSVDFHPKTVADGKVKIGDIYIGMGDKRGQSFMFYGVGFEDYIFKPEDVRSAKLISSNASIHVNGKDYSGCQKYQIFFKDGKKALMTLSIPGVTKFENIFADALLNEETPQPTAPLPSQKVSEASPSSNGFSIDEKIKMTQLIKNYKELLDIGALSEDEYLKKKNDILSQLDFGESSSKQILKNEESIRVAETSAQKGTLVDSSLPENDENKKSEIREEKMIFPCESEKTMQKALEVNSLEHRDDLIPESTKQIKNTSEETVLNGNEKKKARSPYSVSLNSILLIFWSMLLIASIIYLISQSFDIMLFYPVFILLAFSIVAVFPLLCMLLARLDSKIFNIAIFIIYCPTFLYIFFSARAFNLPIILGGLVLFVQLFCLIITFYFDKQKAHDN